MTAEAPHRETIDRRHEPSTTVPVTTDHRTPTGRISAGAGYVLGILRIALGWTFLWAFVDKTFGLGYSTPADNAWIDGGSPTTGYLRAVEGPFEGMFTGMAGVAFWDWLFMIGLLAIGLALLLGIGMRLAAVTGALLLMLMFAASLPLVTNPVIDDHAIQAITVVALAALNAGDYLGFGRQWKRLRVVRRQRWLI